VAFDRIEAERQQEELKAKLRLGIAPKSAGEAQKELDTTWKAFRLQYARLHPYKLEDKFSIHSESELRLDELMHVSWNDPNEIISVWPKRRLAVL